MTSPSRTLASWAASLPRSRTATAFPEATQGVIDLLGCLVGGAAESTPRKAAQFAITLGQGRCTIVGHSTKVSAPAAAFANAASAHILDFDDSFRPLTGHPSCTIVPAILAVAEDRGKSGADLLDAYIVGVEIAASIGRAEPKHHDVGWHGTATVGVVATAVACARLIGLGEEGIASAISIAVSSASGTRGQIGYDVKCIQPGFAARDGVTAAYLAEIGIKGVPEALAGPWGFSSLYCMRGKNESGSYTVPGEDEPLAIVEPGITFKPYPTCGSTHRTLAAVFDLCSKYQLTADQIEGIETIIPFLNTANLRYNDPTNGMQAKFSMSYTCALAVLYGQIRLSDFEDAAVQRAEVQAFMPKIKMVTLPGSEHTDLTFLEMPCTTKITLKTGQVLEDVRYARKGERTDPLSAKEAADKFEDCVNGVMGIEARGKLLDTLWSLGEKRSVVELMYNLA